MLNLTIEVVVMRSPRVGRVLGVFSEKRKREKSISSDPFRVLSKKTKKQNKKRRTARVLSVSLPDFTSTARARARAPQTKENRERRAQKDKIKKMIRINLNR